MHHIEWKTKQSYIPMYMYKNEMNDKNETQTKQKLLKF
jgi:hypothetical protein